jgi:hypothetical protein
MQISDDSIGSLAHPREVQAGVVLRTTCAAQRLGGARFTSMDDWLNVKLHGSPGRAGASLDG